MITRKGLGRGRRLEVTSKERAERKRRRRKRILIFFAVLALTAVVGLVSLLHLRTFRIETVTVEGTESIEQTKIEGDIRGQLDGTYMFIIPRDSIFFYSKDRISRYIKETYPEIQQFSVKLTSPNEITVSIEERKPVGVWCEGGDSAKCFFIDEKGVLFQTAPSITGSVYFKYEGMLESGTSTNPLLATFLPEFQFKKLNEFAAGIKSRREFTPIGFVRTKDSEGSVVTAEGVLLRIALNKDLDAVAINLTSALNASSLKDPGVRSTLEYIDLRFGNSLYYKLRGSSAVSSGE